MSVDLKRLRYFCAIVDHGQISKAAAALNMAQPPLSLRLKELEEEFGVKLIERGTRWCRVTEEGRLLYERAKLILSEVDALSEEMKASQCSPVWVVIGVSSTCASYLMEPLREICGHFPNVKLRVVLGDSDWLESMLGQRCIDFAIMQAPPPEAGLIVDLLPPSRVSVIVPKSLVRPSWGETLRMEDIAPFPLMLLRRPSGGGSYERFIRWFHAHGMSAHVAMDCPDVRIIKDLWRAETGSIAILPESETRDYRPDQACIFSLDEPAMGFHPAIVRPKGMQLNAVAASVIARIVAASEEEAEDGESREKLSLPRARKRA